MHLAADHRRHAQQAPIAVPRYRVLWLAGGQEHRSPWLYRREHAERALERMRAKHGASNTVLCAD